MGAAVGNFAIEHVGNVGAGPFDLGGVLGVSGGHMWRHLGIAVGGELVMLLDQRTATDGSRQDMTSPPGLATARLDFLLPLRSDRGREFTGAARAIHEVMLVAGLGATRIDGALAGGDVSSPVANSAAVSGRTWSLGGQWLRALGESDWLLVDVRFERFSVTGGAIPPSRTVPVARTPIGGGTTMVVRVGYRAYLPSNR